MDFAKKLLKKYGWNEGEGLGKNSDGISKPLKANLKFDNAGLGVDKVAEFNNHWWERVFNDAARNIDVDKEAGDVKINVKDKDSIEITTKDYSVKKLKKKVGKDGYNHFIKKSILNGLKESNEKSNDSEPEEPDLPKYKTLTDEELFAACGGRTAHKGARHGLKLMGKLSRIEEQERELVAKIQLNCADEETRDWKVVCNKKKRKRQEPEIETATINSEEQGIQQDLYINEYHIKSTKKKKEHKKEDNELSFALNAVFATPENGSIDLVLQEKGKERKKKSQESTQNNAEFDIQKAVKKKKRERKLAETEDNKPSTKGDFLKSNDSQDIPALNNKKKKKLKGLINRVNNDLESSLALS